MLVSLLLISRMLKSKGKDSVALPWSSEILLEKQWGYLTQREKCFRSPPGVSSGPAICSRIPVPDEAAARCHESAPCRGSPPAVKACRAHYTRAKQAEIQLQRVAFLCVWAMWVQQVFQRTRLLKTELMDYYLQKMTSFFKNVISTSGKNLISMPITLITFGT